MLFVPKIVSSVKIKSVKIIKSIQELLQGGQTNMLTLNFQKDIIEKKLDVGKYKNGEREYKNGERPLDSIMI